MESEKTFIVTGIGFLNAKPDPKPFKYTVKAESRDGAAKVAKDKAESEMKVTHVRISAIDGYSYP